MEVLSIAEYGELYAHGVMALLDRHAAAVKADDAAEIAEIRAELMAVTGQLLVAAAARGRTMTDDEAALIFSDPVVN